MCPQNFTNKQAGFLGLIASWISFTEFLVFFFEAKFFFVKKFLIESLLPTVYFTASQCALMFIFLLFSKKWIFEVNPENIDYIQFWGAIFIPTYYFVLQMLARSKTLEKHDFCQNEEVPIFSCLGGFFGCLMFLQDKSEFFDARLKDHNNSEFINQTKFFEEFSKSPQKQLKKTQKKQKITLEFEEEKYKSIKGKILKKQDILDEKIQDTSVSQSQQLSQITQKISKKLVIKDPKSEEKLKKKYNTKKNYEEVLDIIREMRKKKDAPVDTQGAGCQADPNMPKNVQDFQTLTSLLLSVQTKDETTDKVMRRLVAEGFDAQKALDMPSQELKEKIFEVNFNQKKVNYIKQCADLTINQFNGTIPNSLKDILKWPGVGYKVANLFLQISHNQVNGISVDTHLHRISNRIGWVQTRTPEETMKKLMEFVDKKYWTEINPLVVGLGQTICKPQNPDCSQCLLNQKCEEGRRRMVGRKKI